MATILTVADAINVFGPPAGWPEWVVYVGRRNNRRGLRGSYLANPYRKGQWVPNGMMRPYQMTAEQCVEAYRVWLLHRCTMGAILDMEGLRRTLNKHGKLYLVCWCGSEHLAGECWCGETHEEAYQTGRWPCHADVVKELLAEEATDDTGD